MSLTANIERVQEVIEKIKLPLQLPEDAFILWGQPRRIPDFDIIVSVLPSELRACLNLEASILHSERKGQSTFLLTLIQDGFLRIKILDKSIVELSITANRQ
jgi:hypothetical protein